MPGSLTLVAALALRLSAQQPPAPAAPQQQSEVRMVIGSGSPGLPPKLAVPAFIALTADAETQAAAKIIGEVLWDDLEFEREFYMIPRDTYRSIRSPPADQLPSTDEELAPTVDGGA